MPLTTDDLISLIDQPREALDIEVKQFLDLDTGDHRATVAKEIIALANHGGGYLVVGFIEADDGSFKPHIPHPTTLSAWSQDSIQGIVAKYVEPGFQCDVRLVTSANSGLSYPVIIVPGGHRVPIRSKAASPDGNKLSNNRIYIRRPGPASEEPKTPKDWDTLLDRCIRHRQSDLVDAFRSILGGVIPANTTPVPPDDILARFIRNGRKRWQKLTDALPSSAGPVFPNGHYACAFQLPSTFEVPSLSELNSLVKSAMRNHSGWPPFVVIDRRPYAPAPIDGSIETWIGPEDDGSFSAADHSDFWRISPDGLMFTMRGYKEDNWHELTPGQSFDLGLNIQRASEATLQAVYLAKALGITEGILDCQFSWFGIEGRNLVSLGDRRKYFSLNYSSSNSSFEASGRIDISLLPDSLPELLFPILRGLYENFSFYSLPKSVLEEEVAALVKHNF